jgi:heme/copper-type cytochrome/quinol oxidase subunit 2
LEFAMLRLILAVALFAYGHTALAADPAEFTIVIREHRFEPAELKVPANTKIKLIIQNEDDSAEEFESHELNREKIVAPKSSITVWVGPLEPGEYPFFGEFHMDTALGKLIAE